MTLALSFPNGMTQETPNPVFKSVRRAAVTLREQAAQTSMASTTTVEFAQPDTWYDEKTTTEVISDMFWSRRNAVGSIRSRKDYRTALRWQAAAALPLFPPVGFVVLALNLCFGLRPKATRIGFIASLALGAIFAANTMLPDASLMVANLR